MSPSKTRLVNGNVEVFDPVRRKFVLLTPEEKVRQGVINYLLNIALYPKSSIAVEKKLVINGLLKRFDVLVYNSSFIPALLVECKNPGIIMNEALCRQAAIYNLSLKVPFLWLTNGECHFFIKNDLAAESYAYLDKLPDFSLL